MEIYLIRHGQTQYNVEGRHTGQADIPINEQGRKQAEKLQQLFADLHFDYVYSSPLQRAMETAQIAAPEAEVIPCEWMKELNCGSWTGLTWQETTERFPEESKLYEDDWLHGKEGGMESYADVQKRVEAGLRQLIPTLKQDARILIAGHGVTVRLAATTLLGLPVEAGLHLLPGQGVYHKLTARPDPESEPWFSLEAWNCSSPVNGHDSGWIH